MSRTKKVSDILANIVLAGGARSEADQERIRAELTQMWESFFAHPVLPEKGQSLCIPDAGVKTAALFFDRVWAIPGNNIGVPKDILAFGATEYEIVSIAVGLLSGEGFSERQIDNLLDEFPAVIRQFTEEKADGDKALSVALSREFGINAVSMFDSQRKCNREYAAGSMQSLLAAIEGVQVVDEGKLSWEQVQEFRRDEGSKLKLRRMRHWLDAELVGKPISFVADEIGVKLEAYETSLRKHGIQTYLGALSDLFDDKFLLGISGAIAGAGLAGGATWAALAGGGLSLGRVTLSITQKLIDLKDYTNRPSSEVAFVHEIKKLTDK